MPRIRTLKPETPHSESLGRVSREARLLFILLFTLVDDSGRTRGNSRMLASLLFPYDDDAPNLIENWLEELEREQCVRRYIVDEQVYLEIINWLKHQRIDKPTESKLPGFQESSRILANCPGGNRNGKERKGRDLEVDQGMGPGVAPRTARASRPKQPTVAKTAKTWQSYAAAYASRYGVEPLRDATVNAQLSRFIDRVGAEDAPAIAAFYVEHSKAFYVSRQHPVGSLLADAEGLRTQWANGRIVTDTEARHADRKQSNRTVAETLIAEARANASK